MSRVIVVGSINQDMVAEAERHPCPGETVIGRTLRFHPGGKGANQAVAAARAGSAAVLIGCLGDDEAGKALLAVLQSSGVDCSAVRNVPDVPTGRGIITLAGGENTIVVIAGANACVTPELVARVEFAPGDICVAQLETPVETTVYAFRRARTAGATTVFNPAPAQQAPDELLVLSDILVVNVHEFSAIYGVPVGPCLNEGRLPESAFRGSLIATLGADGVAIRGEGRWTRIPGLSVEAVDSTGAGDCFVGYLAAGLALGNPLEQAALRANRAAAISVTRHGAISSIPHAAEVAWVTPAQG